MRELIVEPTESRTRRPGFYPPVRLQHHVSCALFSVLHNVISPKKVSLLFGYKSMLVRNSRPTTVDSHNNSQNSEYNAQNENFIYFTELFASRFPDDLCINASLRLCMLISLYDNIDNCTGWIAPLYDWPQCDAEGSVYSSLVSRTAYTSRASPWSCPELM